MGSYLDSDDEGFEKEGQLKGRTESMGRVVGKTDSMGKGEWGRMDSMGRDEVRSGREDTISGASPSRLQAFRLSLGRSMAHLRRPSAGAKETVIIIALVWTLMSFLNFNLIHFQCSAELFYGRNYLASIDEVQLFFSGHGDTITLTSSRNSPQSRKMRREPSHKQRIKNHQPYLRFYCESAGRR